MKETFSRKSLSWLCNNDEEMVGRSLLEIKDYQKANEVIRSLILPKQKKTLNGFFL